jgi:hypothetical protein
MTDVADWMSEWQEVVDAIGTDFGDGRTRFGVDVIERSGVRRWCEPLEFASALHHDPSVAEQHGFGDVIAPYTAMLSWTMPAMWSPGDPPLFVDDGRDAQPARSAINSRGIKLGPKTTGFFATDMELDFIRPAQVGERIGRRGHRLTACSPKETAVGRGAFLTWESEIVTESGEVLARIRTSTYSYVPRPRSPRDEGSAT